MDKLKTELIETYGENDVYTTGELTELFEVHSFLAPYVVVTEKATGHKGSMQFTHAPRFYFGFVRDRG